jgi:hypothetical protein
VNRKRGRPSAPKPFEMTIHLTLRYGEDDDLIEFLSHIPNGMVSRTITTSLRAGGIKPQAATPNTLDLSASEDALDNLTL